MPSPPHSQLPWWCSPCDRAPLLFPLLPSLALLFPLCTLSPCQTRHAAPRHARERISAEIDMDASSAPICYSEPDRAVMLACSDAPAGTGTHADSMRCDTLSAPLTPSQPPSWRPVPLAHDATLQLGIGSACHSRPPPTTLRQDPR